MLSGINTQKERKMKSAQKSHIAPPAPACRTATLRAMDARMKKAYPPLSSFKKGKVNKKKHNKKDE